MTGRHKFSDLTAKMPPERRARITREAEKLRAEMPLHELRNALELSQKHLAEVLHVDQPAISKLERRTDMMISTLSRFVEAMGGRLDIRAVFPEGEVSIKALGDVWRERETA